MSQLLQVNNGLQVQPNEINQGPNDVANNQQQVAPPVQEHPAPVDVNAQALSRLSDTDRAAAEVFLKGVSTQEALKHTKWSLATKIISGLFSFGIAPAIMCHVESKKERQLMQDVVRLKDTLNSLDKNKALNGTAVVMDGKRMGIDRDANGVLTATIGGERIVSNYNAKTLAEKIEDDIVSNSDLYGTKAALDVLAGPKPQNAGQAKPVGHAGQSLIEQHNKAMQAIDRRIAKAEAAVKKNPEAMNLQPELAEAQRKYDQLQTEFDQTEMTCNQTIRNSDDQLKAADTAQRLLDADLQSGAVDAGGVRQKAIDDLRGPAREAKNTALNKLRELETRRPELYKAMAYRDKLLHDNPALVELNDARKEKADKIEAYEKQVKSLTTRLQELEASPERDTPAVQNEISSLKLVLAPPQKQGEKQVNPLVLDTNNPADAVDSKGLNDARLRELCLKSIKASLGIDGGELHSCPTRYLSRIAQYAIEGYYGSATNLLDHVLKIATTSRIASGDVMELMDLRKEDANVAQKVNVAVLKPKIDATATATQKQVTDFAADIIYSGNIVDEDTLSPEDRLRKVLQTNAGVIGDVIKVEAGLNAIDLETKAREAEQRASLPNATEADKLEAKAARAEANAAQFEARTLRGNTVVKGLNKFFSFFGDGPDKPDEAQFTGLEAQAYAAEANVLRDKDRNKLVSRVVQLQAEVEEYSDDVGRLNELTDAQKALENYDKKSSIVKKAIEARLAVRLARAEAQAKFSEDPDDAKKASDLRTAIEAAKPGLPESTLGAEFDEPADTALEKRLTKLDDLPEAERTSLLSSLPPEMSEAIKDMMGEMRTALVQRNMYADHVNIGLGITQLETEDLKKIVGQVNESVNKAAQTVQEEMTTAILMMDNTLSAPTKAVIRELKAVFEAENLPFTEENLSTLLGRKPLPSQVAITLDALSGAITGVDDPAQRRHLAGKVVANAFMEYARLADNANKAQELVTQTENDARVARNLEQTSRQALNASLTRVSNADEQWKAKQTQATESQTQAEQAETTAHNAEVTAQGIEAAYADQPQNAREAIALDRTATEAENRAASLEAEAANVNKEALDAAENRAVSLEAEAARAKDVADEAMLLTSVAGAPADAAEKAQVARKAADEAAAAAASARSEANAIRKLIDDAANARAEAVTARNAANAAIQTVDPDVLADARTVLQSATDARQQATRARERANAARATANQHQADFVTAKQVFDQAVAAHAGVVKAHTDAQTAESLANAAKEKAQQSAQAAQAEADIALGINQPAAEGGNAPDNAQAAAPANAQEAHRQRLEQLAAAPLDKLVASAGTDFSSDGVGKFVKFVIQDYFQSVPLMDKRAMVSAGLRYAPPKASSMQQLGAMLKGAGPVLQKIFQGLDGPGLPQDLRIACQDMKSRLAPIPPEIVESTLLDMVNSSNGRIRNIEVLSSLGAASVGQAFRCRITDQNGQARECVVKILRPDATNRIQRERPIFEKAAAKVPGMQGTFQGQMEGIMEELDFGIEAGNAKTGVVYDKPFDGPQRSIQSVKIVEDIPPKSTSMAMEMAPGTTIDGFLKDTREEIERMGQNLGRVETFDSQGQRSRVTYDVADARVDEIIPVKARLQELYDQAQARHKQLTALADMWVTEGIFGQNGFFHGDLHTGNIMSDGNKLTVIDFGNATKLTTEQQSSVMTMIVATTTRQSSKFLDAFRSMLPPSGQAVFDGKKEQILESVRVIMQKGNLGDTGGRIAAILAEIQRNGVEIPHAVYNFSNSQIRLQNSINEMITLMNHIGEEMRALDTLRSIRSPEVLPFDRNITNTVLAAMADEGQSHSAVMNYIAHYRALVEDPNSELSQEQETDVRTALSFISFTVDLKATSIDNDPNLLKVWNDHKEALENTEHPQREEAITALLAAMRTKALNTLDALRAEEEKDNSRGANPVTFLDVMGDVVETNYRSAVKKLGLGSSIKYGITSFINEKITSWVQPKI